MKIFATTFTVGICWKKFLNAAAFYKPTGRARRDRHRQIMVRSVAYPPLEVTVPRRADAADSRRNAPGRSAAARRGSYRRSSPRE